MSIFRLLGVQSRLGILLIIILLVWFLSITFLQIISFLSAPEIGELQVQTVHTSSSKNINEHRWTSQLAARY